MNDAMNRQLVEVKEMLVFVSLPHVLSNKFQNLKVKEFVTKRTFCQKGSALAHTNCSNDDLLHVF